VEAQGIALVATTCPTCSTVRVYLGAAAAHDPPDLADAQGPGAHPGGQRRGLSLRGRVPDQGGLLRLTGLAIAIGLILVAALVAWLTPGPFVDPRPARGLGPLLIPARLVAPVVPLAIAIVGLVWMICIFRGPRDELPPWRHQDR
jgi:hypothetical protein